MSQIEIVRTDGAEGGRYEARVAGVDGAAELTYARRGRDTVYANHTFAPPSMRGSGVALALVERLVADARAEGFKIIPSCSYVAAQARRHPEWADLFAQ